MLDSVSRTHVRTPLEISIGALTAAAIAASVARAGSIGELRGPAASAQETLIALLVALAFAYVFLYRPPARLGATAVAAATLALLGLLSPLWSVAPRDSLRTAIALALLLAGAWAMSAAAAASPKAAASLLAGLAGGGALVAAASFVYLIARPGNATFLLGPPDLRRFRGLGENANTVPLVAALTIGAAAWWATYRTRIGAVFGWTAVVLLLGVAVAAGSRGSTIAAAAALVTFAAASKASRRARLALAGAAVLAIAALAFGVDERIPDAVAAPSAGGAASLVENVPQPLPRAAPQFPGNPGELHAEVGDAEFLGGGGVGSGRLDAWRGALEQALDRPVAGYGLGTEDPVFVDRYPGFQGAYVESSFVGATLHLGVAGLLALGAAVVAAALAAGRARREASGVAVAAGATVVAGAALALIQSYALAPAGVGVLPFWIGVLLASAVGDRPGRRAARWAAAAATLCVAVAAVGAYQSAAHTRDLRAGIRGIRAAAGPLEGPRLAAFRIAWFGDCFAYRAGGSPYALEMCYDRSGRLIEAIDRRGGEPRFWNLRFDRDETPVTVPPQRLATALQRAGGIAYAERYLQGYPPTGTLADSTLIPIRPWLRMLRAATPGAGPGTA